MKISGQNKIPAKQDSNTCSKHPNDVARLTEMSTDGKILKKKIEHTCNFCIMIKSNQQYLTHISNLECS